MVNQGDEMPDASGEEGRKAKLFYFENFLLFLRECVGALLMSFYESHELHLAELVIDLALSQFASHSLSLVYAYRHDLFTTAASR